MCELTREKHVTSKAAPFIYGNKLFSYPSSLFSDAQINVRIQHESNNCRRQVQDMPLKMIIVLSPNKFFDWSKRIF